MALAKKRKTPQKTYMGIACQRRRKKKGNQVLKCKAPKLAVAYNVKLVDTAIFTLHSSSFSHSILDSWNANKIRIDDGMLVKWRRSYSNGNISITSKNLAQSNEIYIDMLHSVLRLRLRSPPPISLMVSVTLFAYKKFELEVRIRARFKAACFII